MSANEAALVATESASIPGHAPRVEVCFETSSTIGKLAAALAAAQGEMEHAIKDGDNPHFKSSFATLASVTAAIKGPLSKHGVARHQAPMSTADKPDIVGVRTTLMHGSGEWIAATVWSKAGQPGPQALGSVITYLRRYSLAAAAGVAPDDDDDGEGAEGRGASPKGQQTRGRTSSQPSANDSTGTSASATGSGVSSGTPPDDEAVGRALKLSRLLTSAPPDGCGWTKPHCQKWGKKRFGVDDPTQLTEAQYKDAMLLALAYMQGGDTGYKAKLDELVAAGRVRGDDEKGKAA